MTSQATQVQILVLDFGSQYTQLIARRLREYGVYTEIVPYFEKLDSIKSKNPKGIILSGGPASVYEEGAYKPDSEIFNLGIPVLGICYGMQYIAHHFGGKVVRAQAQEFGKAVLEIIDDNYAFARVEKEREATYNAWESAFIAGHSFMGKKVLSSITNDVKESIEQSKELIDIKCGDELVGFGLYEDEKFSCFRIGDNVVYSDLLEEFLKHLSSNYTFDTLYTTWDTHDKTGFSAYENLGFTQGAKHGPMRELSISKEALDSKLSKERSDAKDIKFSTFDSVNFPQMLEALVDLWEDSVRSTHDFLNEDDIRVLKDEVREGLKSCEAVIVASNENDFLGFIAGQGNKIEMLFVAQKYFHQGIGKKLVYQACVRYLHDYKSVEVDCNTQNTQAMQFYKKLGFSKKGESAKDSKGRDFPITYFECALSHLQESLCEVVLSTERVYLRHLRSQDFEALHKILSKKEVMYAWGHGFSKSDSKEWFDRRIQSYKDYGFGFYAVIDKASGKLIGNAGIEIGHINMNGQELEVFEIGYVLDDSFWDKGLATEIARSLKDYAFNVLELSCVHCLIKEDNSRSMKVARKLGMRVVGEFMKHYKGKELLHYVMRLDSKSNSAQSHIAHSNNALFSGVKQDSIVWMSHADKVEEIPQGFIELAKSGNTHYCAIANLERQIYALQFHPEVVHSECGGEMLKNFAVSICGADTSWDMKHFAESEIRKLKEVAKNGKVLCAVSGGVDSSVVATLLYRAIGENLIPVFVDTGLLRAGEREAVEAMFRENLGVPLITIDASEIFLGKLKGIIDPEVKRKIIGETFIKVFEKEAKKHNENGEIKFLAQGTLYPDVIESVSVKGPSKTIKSHHNVGGLPDWMKFELIEPLRELFKDEVRALGRELGMPETMLMRHPFPGPGLAIRIMGEVNKADLDLLRACDSIFIEELHKHNLYNKVWQAFCVLLNVKSVGVMGDNRTYDNTICVRAVEALDGMTATFSHLPHSFLEGVANRIINEVQGINRVVYDITSKPPGTIEWE